MCSVDKTKDINCYGVLVLLNRKLEVLSNKVEQQTRRQIESLEVEKYQKMAPSFPNIPLVRGILL